MATHQTALAARIAAVNNANAYANELYELLVPIFTPLVGKQICKNDGTLLAKIAKLLPEFPNTVPLQVYKRASAYSLVFTVKTCETHQYNSDSGHAHYHEASVTIGEFEYSNYVLKSISPPPQFRTDYTVESVVEAREAYRVAKKLADYAHSKLWPFGEFDR